MITLKQLTDKLSSALNAQGNPGITFVLHNDTGEYVKAVREDNDVKDIVNGMVSVTSSEVQNTSEGLTIATMTTRVELLVPCRDTEEDINEIVLNDDGTYGEELARTGNKAFLQSVRNWLDEFCANNGTTTMTDEDGKIYNVSYVYSLVATGIRQMDSFAGDSFTFVIYADYTLIQGGLNSREVKIFLDGTEIGYSNMTLRRVPTQEVSVFSGAAIGKSLTSDTVLGISVSLPASTKEITSTVLDYILHGNRNVTHFLELRTENDSNFYLVQFGQNEATASGVLNVGMTVTFVEVPDEYEFLKFPDEFYIYEATASGSNLTFKADGDTILYRFGGGGFAEFTDEDILNLVKGEIIVSTEQITNAYLLPLMPISRIEIPAGTYKISPMFAFPTERLTQELTAKGYFLTANNTYSEEVGISKIDIVPAPSALIHITTTVANVTNEYEDEWYTDNNNEAYTATDTNKIRTLIFEESQPVSEEFYKWAIINNNLLRG